MAWMWISLASILLFVISSWLCGMAPNIEILIAARILQGAVAGPMIPLSQSLLLGSYPPAKSSMALALWGMTTLVAPIMGPLLGGWISDNYSWPWIFYINIPVGLFTAWATWSIYRKRESAIKALPIDKVGLFLLVVWVGALQLMLDKGKELDWFSSGEIILLTVVAVIGLIYFVIWETGQDHPVVDLSLFKGRNFSAGVVAISIGYGLFFGSLVIMPLWLQTQLSYTATEAGKVMAPVGIFAILLSPVIGKILPKVDARKVASVAFLGFALVFFLRAGFTTEVDTITLLIPTLLQGAAMSMFFIPLTSIVLSGQPPDKIPAASGLSNFVRIMCGGMGASIMTTMWDSRSTMHHAHITEHTGSSSQAFVQTVQGLNQQGIPDAGAYALIDRIISVQASTMAATDLFYMAAFMFLGLIGLVWLTKPKKSSVPVDAGGTH